MKKPFQVTLREKGREVTKVVNANSETQAKDMAKSRFKVNDKDIVKTEPLKKK